jgi:hypothetical protein
MKIVPASCCDSSRGELEGLEAYTTVTVHAITNALMDRFGVHRFYVFLQYLVLHHRLSE